MADLTHVGVVGAGTMGHGIAQVAALAGYHTVLFDQTLSLAEQGFARIRDNLEKGVLKGKVTPEVRDLALSRVALTASLEDFAPCGLVIEAVPEQLSLKRQTFEALSRVCLRDAVLATNTSALSVTEIAASASHPERVVGMHFFNPVHLMKLLELIRAFQTSDETLARARAVGERMGKQVILIQDHPGFASTRLGIVLGMQAIRMVEEGIATPRDIDQAMELGYGHPMGPLALTDLVGLDVRLAIAQSLFEELGEPAFRPPQLLKKMVRAGKLGRKSGQGFYTY